MDQKEKMHMKVLGNYRKLPGPEVLTEESSASAGKNQYTTII
jgi:hypothetical protein